MQAQQGGLGVQSRKEGGIGGRVDTLASPCLHLHLPGRWTETRRLRLLSHHELRVEGEAVPSLAPPTGTTPNGKADRGIRKEAWGDRQAGLSFLGTGSRQKNNLSPPPIAHKGRT